MKVSDYIADFIASQGVRHVFLLPGGGNMHLVDSVGKERRLEYVACLHEQAASIAADAYAHYTQNLGVVLVTTGPGGTNAITGIAGSYVESVPVLAISGQVKTPDIKPTSQMRMLGFQEVEITTIVRSITKYAVTIMEPQTIRYHLEKAVYLARSGRPGPVWIDVPLDVQAADIEPDSLRRFDPSEIISVIKKNQDRLGTEVDRLLDLLSRADRPVILAGYGIKIAKSELLFTHVIESLGVPVLTTWKGCDLLFNEHPLFFGRPGTLAHRGANFIQQNSDLILTIGARLDFGQIGYASETFARGAKKVIVDIDEHEFTKFHFRVDVPIVADAGDFLSELSRRLPGFAKKNWSAWLRRCAEWKERFLVVSPEQRTVSGSVSMYMLIDELSRQMSPEDLLVPGSSGACSDVCMQSFRIKRGQRVINSPGIGAMGFGLPHTIGACLASGRRRTICVNGDGGIQLNIQDLETVRRLKLPIKYFILNNKGYGSIRVTQNSYFHGHLVASDESSGLTLPNIRRIGEAYGIPTSRISSHAFLEKGVEDVLKTDGPHICEVIIDPDEQTTPKVRSVIGRDGRMVSKPLEDLAPFLDREEFKRNMIVTPLPD